MAEQDRVNVIERRLPPFAWQEKEALRLMRDYFGGRALVVMRSLYLALTEIVSDHPAWGDTILTSDLYGGSRAILTYSGLTHDAYAPARRALEALRLIRVEPLRNEQGHKVGLAIQLLPCPVRPDDPPRHKINHLADIPKTGEFVPLPLNPESGSRASLNPESLNPESLIRDSGAHIEEGVNIEKRVSVEQTDANASEQAPPTPADQEAAGRPAQAGEPAGAGKVQRAVFKSEKMDRTVFLAYLREHPPRTRAEYNAAICGLARRTPWYDYLEKERGFSLARLLGKAVMRGLNGDGPPRLEKVERLLRSLTAAQEIPRPEKRVAAAWGWYVRRVQAIMDSEVDPPPPFDFHWSHPARDGKTWAEVLCPKEI